MVVALSEFVKLTQNKMNKIKIFYPAAAGDPAYLVI